MNKSKTTNTRLKDIAKLAGVSIGTVDRVLHNRGEVSSETRELVLRLIEEQGYTPNIIAKSLASKKKYVIAILVPDVKNDNPYWDMPVRGIKQAGEELMQFNFELSIYSFTDEENFKVISKEILLSNPDGVILTPHYYTPSIDFINQCDASKIPYVLFDFDIENSNRLAYFGQDSAVSGYTAAKLMYMGLSKKAEVMVLTLVTKTVTNRHLHIREAGFRSFFQSNENNKGIIVRSAEIDISSDHKIFECLDEILSKNPVLEGVFVINSRVHKVAKYFEAKDIRDIFLMGYDLLDENIYYLYKNVIYLLIGQKPEEQGYKCVMALFDHLIMKKQIVKINYSPVDIIIKENLKYYKLQ